MSTPTEPTETHYLRDVTALGDSREVRTTQAILSANQIKLVDKGVRLDSSLYERLMRHKLQTVIEECVSVEGGVTAGELRAEATALLDSDCGYSLLKDSSARPAELLLALENAPLDAPLGVRLTVMRERRPEMFKHCVGVALLMAYLGRRAARVSGELAQWAGAGLYHDLGEMHIEPGLLGAGKPLGDDERQHMRAHPLTAYLILQMRTVCTAQLADAVLEHHERMDGSGYPRGTRGDKLSEAGRALAIAELASTFFPQPRDGGALRRLPVVLQLNHRRFDRSFANHIIALARQAKSPEEAGGGSVDSAIERVRAIQGIFRDWHATTETGMPAGTEAAFKFVAERMEYLERSLLESGLDVAHDPKLAASLAEDPESRAELPAAARELSWLLTEVLQGLQLRLGKTRSEPMEAWVQKANTALGIKPNGK